MITYSNPRLKANFEDWTIGGYGKKTGQCKFQVEYKSGFGYRVSRTTTNATGVWCKPKTDTYGGRTIIVDGDDRKVYILQKENVYRGIRIVRSDFKMSEKTVFEESNPERYKELAEMIDTFYEKGTDVDSCE